MKRFLCVIFMHLAIVANLDAMKKAGESALEDHKRSFIASKINAGVSPQAAEHLYFFDMIASLGGNVEEAHRWSVLRGLLKNDSPFIQELSPHLSSRVKGNGEGSLISLAISDENMPLAKAIIDHALCCFVRKKTAENQPGEQFPFLENYVCGHTVRTLIRFANRDQKLVLDPYILSCEEMDQWEVVR